MKLNWGQSIVIVIIAFVLGIGLMVYISFQHEVNLVHKDYYPKEIVYQEMINKENNLRLVNQRVTISEELNVINIKFPEFFLDDLIDGKILFFRPSDSEKDKIIDIKTDNIGEQRIITSELLHGKYIVKLEWKYKDVEYYQEEEIFIKK